MSSRLTGPAGLTKSSGVPRGGSVRLAPSLSKADCSMGPRTGVWRGGSGGASEDAADCAGGALAGCGASAVGLPSGAFQSTCDSWLA
eukprot:8198679-Alexandrium_andersonii.AAC.1